MKKSLVLLALMVVGGCSSTEHKLEAKWAPLEAIYERPGVVRDLLSDTAITTLGKYAYVKDLDEWLARVPIGSAKYQAILRHEQEHSSRQRDAGITLWLARYSVDKDFALEEEKIGYYYEITERRRLGDLVIPENYALVLSNYKNLSGRLISFADALVWVRAVLNGQWVPPS